jgi:hypothetical protein
MAGIALDLRVGGAQRKSRCLAVIKPDCRPLGLVVAAFALGSIPSRVHILDFVAIHTSQADTLVAFPRMARGAENRAMRAPQREPGLIVVE